MKEIRITLILNGPFSGKTIRDIPVDFMSVIVQQDINVGTTCTCSHGFDVFACIRCVSEFCRKF